MRKLTRKAIASLALGLSALAGCTELIDDPGILAELYGDFRQSRQTPDDIRPLITPANVKTTGVPIIFAELPKREQQAILSIQTTTRGRIVWVSGDGAAFTEYNGVLVGTRGLGNDLMNVDTGEVGPALRGERSTATRVNRYMNGLGQIVAVPIVCDYTRQGQTQVELTTGLYSATQITESCTGKDDSFENVYWFTPSGKPRKTRNWINADVGFVDLEFLTN